MRVFLEGWMIQVSYDPRADALYIRLREAKIDESDEVSSGVIVDYDRKGKPVGVEVLDASHSSVVVPTSKSN